MNLNNNQIRTAVAKSKNIAQGSFLETEIEAGFVVMTCQNESSEVQLLEKEIDSSFIQFHFCLKGQCRFVFNNGTYGLNISEENSLSDLIKISNIFLFCPLTTSFISPLTGDTN